ncbi:non-ribosomal peptide synthetase [Symbioplanes lichenis]|uniref:non-ribosomal peptide synthetase n=1 Tax=Symbioplanes lichenis TaxID=1629072 RepID=UPI00273A3DCE|nr:non-ribosomal peptide synthetase [Actinoplanes lichenis]
MPDGQQHVTFPVAASQRGLLVADRWLQRPEVYNQIVQFELAAGTPFERVRSAIIDLVFLQPALRQVFRLQPDITTWLGPRPKPGDVTIMRNTAEHPDYERATALLIDELARQPFDLTIGPPYRFGYVSTRDGSAARIVLCLHHVVFDGMSLGPLMRDLEETLTGHRTQNDLHTRGAERDAAYVRELSAQAEARTLRDLPGLLADWSRELRLVPPLVLAPGPHRPAEPSHRGARRPLRLDPLESATFDRACRSLAVSPYTFLTGVFGAVLGRHGGVSTVLVGSPFNARRTVGSYDLCGFFVNTLPVMVEIPWASTVKEFLGTSVRNAVDFCRSRADIALQDVVAAVQPERTGDRNPLFSCLLAMQDTGDDRPGDAVTGVHEPATGWAKFDLWLGASRIGDTWSFDLEYDTSLVSGATARQILDSFREALDRACDDASRTVADLFRDAVQPLPPVPCPPAGLADGARLVDWIDATARRLPDATAVEEKDRRLTYRELMAATEDIAAGLAQSGVSAGDFVAVAGDRLSDSVSAILAVLRCGATFVPLDPALPVDRLDTMVRIAGCRIMIGAGIELAGVRTMTAPDLAVRGNGKPRVGRDPTRGPAYVMFTSGSTGRPKGVLMGEGPLLILAAWQHAALRQDENTRYLQYAPLSFDVSYLEIFPVLAAGGVVVAREPADRRDFPALVERVREARVSHLFLPTAALRPFVLSALRAGVALPELRHICAGGEQLVLDDVVRKFLAEMPHCELVNIYGPTETHAVTAHHLPAGEHEWPAHVPIGRPMPGVVTYVVDATGHLAPPGVPGELYLAGSCLSDGYLNDPERTAASFVEDRFAGDGGRMYRTGDYVIRDEDGVLVYLGRLDTQVKIRGYRVELGEIETTATGVDGVQEAVAVARRTDSDADLVLFLRAAPGANPDHDEVRRKLGASLPAYMLPKWIFNIDHVPVSGTGKTDRVVLAGLSHTLIAEANTAAAPSAATCRDDTERELAALWGEILGVDTIDPGRSLLQYGAHSLNIFVALGRMENRYGAVVDVGAFFRDPTVAALAGLVRDRSGTV